MIFKFYASEGLPFNRKNARVEISYALEGLPFRVIEKIRQRQEQQQSILAPRGATTQ
jgi:hypothetical protein